MWFKRTPAPTDRPSTVACETCGHIVLESSANFVSVHGGKWWYCHAHRKAYDEYVLGTQYNYYYRRMRVTNDGTPFGYTPIAEKPRWKT